MKKILILLAVLLFLAACAPKDGTKAEIESLVQNQSISQVVGLGEDAVPFLEEMTESEDLYTRNAAAFTLGEIGKGLDEAEQKKILVYVEKLLGDSNPTIRARAAVAACGLGSGKAKPVLEALVSSTEIMAFIEPPMPVSRFAELGLEECR